MIWGTGCTCTIFYYVRILKKIIQVAVFLKQKSKKWQRLSNCKEEYLVRVLNIYMQKEKKTKERKDKYGEWHGNKYY